MSFTCQDCDLGCVGPGAGMPVVQGEGPLNAKIVFIASAPQMEEQSALKPMIGPVGRGPFNQALRQAGIQRSECYVTYIIKHPLKEGQKKPNKKELTACRKFLDIEFAALTNKRVIIPLGADALAAIVGYGSVNGLRGRALPWSEDPNVAVCPTFTPASFQFNPNPQKLAMFQQDLVRASEIAEGGELAKKTDVTIVRKLEDFDGLIAQIKETGRLAFDLETSGLSPRTKVITDVCFSAKAGTAYVVPVNVWNGDGFTEKASKNAIQFTKDLLCDPGIMKITHGGLFDYTFLVVQEWVTIEDVISQWVFDTMYFHFLGLDESPPHILEFLAGAYLDMPVWDEEKLRFEKEHGKGEIYRMPYKARATYGGGDADATWRLSEVLPTLGFEGSIKVYRTIMMPMLPGIVEMQVAGLEVDLGMVDEVRAKYLRAFKKKEHIIRDMLNVGSEETFNCNSADQMVPRMGSELGFVWPDPQVKKYRKLWTATFKRVSLQADKREQLEKLLPHPIWAVYTEFKQLDKLLGYTGRSADDFTEGSLPGSVCPVSGRIHTNIRPSVAATGRRSSSEPNLQNIPVRSAEGKLLRNCFRAKDGYSFIVPDLDTAEAFVAAYVSQDPKMMAIFENAEVNIHTQNASVLFDMPYDEVGDKSPERDASKTFLFGTFYGAMADSLSKKMQVSGVAVDEAIVQDMSARFFQEYELFAQWRQTQVQSVIERGFTESEYGFRRHYVWPKETWAQHAVERQAYNMAIQSTVAGHVARAYQRVQQALHHGVVDGTLYREGGYDGTLVLEVHDELMAEVRDDQAEEFLPVMIKAMTFPVPTFGKAIPVSGDIRKRWLPEPKGKS